MKLSSLTLATTTAVLFGSAAFAQTAFDGTNKATDGNEVLREAVADDFEVETTTFGNEGRKLGYSGSLALRASATSGNTDSADIGIGADVLYFDGINGYSLELNYAYGEDEGTTTEENLFFDAQYTRDFGPSLYGFAKVQGSIGEFSALDSDYFVGVGAGYRVYDSSQMRWTVQGGPGYRTSSLNPVKLVGDALEGDLELNEAAFSAGSNFYYKLSDTAFLTNNTDILASESDTAINNEIGVTVAMSNNLALRTSLATAYHSDPADGYKNSDNTFGVSLVFNY